MRLFSLFPLHSTFPNCVQRGINEACIYSNAHAQKRFLVFLFFFKSTGNGAFGLVWPFSATKGHLLACFLALQLNTQWEQSHKNFVWMSRFVTIFRCFHTEEVTLLETFLLVNLFIDLLSFLSIHWSFGTKAKHLEFPVHERFSLPSGSFSPFLLLIGSETLHVQQRRHTFSCTHRHWDLHTKQGFLHFAGISSLSCDIFGCACANSFLLILKGSHAWPMLAQQHSHCKILPNQEYRRAANLYERWECK